MTDGAYQIGGTMGDKTAGTPETLEKRIVMPQAEIDQLVVDWGMDDIDRALQNLELARRRLAAERDELRKCVMEWLCDNCNFVYPGPPQAGFACVQCPRCKGNTAPRTTVELRRLEAERDRLTSELEAARKDAIKEASNQIGGTMSESETQNDVTIATCPSCHQQMLPTDWADRLRSELSAALVERDALLSNSAWLDKCIQEERAAKEAAERRLAALAAAIRDCPGLTGDYSFNWRKKHAEAIAIAQRKGGSHE